MISPRRLRVAGHPDDDERSRALLAEFRRRGFNFGEDEDMDGPLWQHDDHRQPLPPEAPGPPEPGGSWAAARRLMAGYEFADPSIVHAIFDPDEPLEGRTMLLELRLAGRLRLAVGTRVVDVYEREEDGVHVWGWEYRTLEGHIEAGRMDWQVRKQAGTGAVEFRVVADSRRATDDPWLLQLGFRLLGRRRQAEFLRSTQARMVALTRAALDPGGDVRAAAEQVTAHRHAGSSAPHERLAGRLEDG